MRHISHFIFVFILSTQARAQSESKFIPKLIKQYLSSQKDTSRAGSFMILPAFGYAPERGAEFGLVSNYSFYTDKSDTNSRTSNITMMATLTTKKQKNIKLVSDIWTKDNAHHIVSEIRFRDWPYNFYGLGNTTWSNEEDPLNEQLVRIKVDVEKKLSQRIYSGLNIHFDDFKINDIAPDGVFTSPDIRGKKGGQYLALGGSFLFDSRNVTTYSTKGAYIRTKYAYAPDFWGGENFSGSLAELDSRYFSALTKDLTVSAQGLYRGTWGKDVPFYVLRDLGGDNTMRGYYLGRYKDNNYATLQSELKYRFMPRFGAVLFGGIGSTFSRSHKFRTVPSYGGGLRYFFSLEHLSTVRFDYAFGEQRPGEKRQQGFYISLSEAF